MVTDKIIQGDCIDVLKTLPDGIVNTCITSPPYFGLRDYGTATWEGGDINCDHIEKFQKHGGERSNRDQTSQIFQAQKVCKKCGAVRVDKQIGLEETPDQYVQRLVEVFREVRRVLRDDGTLWLNLGDSYNNTKNGNTELNKHKCAVTDSFTKKIWKELKPKDLIGIPWRVAFALQADGWYLRQDIIWHKPNPMPESVTDRCTKSHEYIFLLSKSKKYYYDYEAIKEQAISDGPRGGNLLNDTNKGPNGGHERWIGERKNDWGENGRNKRSVWTVATKPFSEAHFATFPEELINPCVLAGSPEGGLVYDPFMGAGTTAYVAKKLGRHFLGSELNPEYIKIANKRVYSIEESLFI